jgi:hypothetical protein
MTDDPSQAGIPGFINLEKVIHTQCLQGYAATDTFFCHFLCNCLSKIPCLEIWIIQEEKLKISFFLLKTRALHH